MKTKTEKRFLHIAQLGVPIIRKRAIPVKKIDEETKILTRDMIATCKEVEGVGIAAPQVFQGLQIFILASYPNPRYPTAPKMKPMAVLNPKIVARSSEMEKGWEGCLSIPGIRGFVPRHISITAEYTTIEGIRQKKIFTGFVAKIFQHEYDHLQGHVFVDRVDTKDIITEAIYQKMTRKLLKKSITHLK